MDALASSIPSQAWADLKVIDTDTHLSEPVDLWTKRAPAKLRDRVPQIGTYNGKTSWLIDGKIPIGLGASASSIFHRDGRKTNGLEFVGWQNEDVHPASYDVRARLQLMDESGIHAQILYPNILGFGGQNTALVDLELREASVRIYNDAMAELQEESGNRILPMALLPWWDIKSAVAEAERAHDMGLHGININSDPQDHLDAEGNRLPDLSIPYWDPLWEVCSALDLPINFHIGASEQSMDWMGNLGWPSLTNEMKASLGGSMLFINNGRVMGNIILSGLLDRFPALKFVSVESGIGWIPFILESLNYQVEHINAGANLLYKPSEYFKKNFYGCFWFEQQDITNTAELVGIDNVMFETDFPHIVCLYPSPLEFMDKALAKMDESGRRKVMSTNAAGVYNIPI